MMNTSSQHVDHFVQLLKLTLVNDNNQRKQAEAELARIENESKVNLLLHVLMSQTDQFVLEIASVMLRQITDRISTTQPLSPPTLLNLKSMILQLCLQQENSKIRLKYADIVSSLINLFHHNKKVLWPEVGSFFYDCIIRSNFDSGKEIAFRLIESSPCILECFKDENISEIVQVICDTMSSDQSINQALITQSLRAFSSLIVDIPKSSAKKIVSAPLSVILRVIGNSNYPTLVEKFVKELSFMIDCRGNIFRKYTIPCVETMLGILSSQSTSEEIRKEAMECLVVQSKGSKKHFRTVAKDWLPSIVEIFIRHITLMQDDPSWVLDSHEDCDDEEDDLPRAAETSLDRFTCEIGGKTMFPIIMSKLEPLFSSNIWQHRAAALITLACSAEGCSRDMKPFLPSIIKAIPQFMQDSHPRVVYYCINAIGQLTSDFSGYFHKHFHQEIFPLVISAAEKYSECPRVQAHAICCFINLMEECPPDILELYQDQMFERLHSFFILSAKNLNKPCMPLLLENALSAISILAESLEKGFIKYYRTIAPDLISLIKSFVGTPHIRYYISSFQALSAILLAVGQNECIHEMDSILEVLKSFEIRSYKVDDSDENYRLDYLNIMANIAQVFGDKFSPILPILIPILIELASVSVDSEIISSAITSLETDGDEKIFSKVFSAHTDALKDKNDACLIIKKLCESVKSSMGNHVDELCQVMMTNITDCYDEDIQASACIIFPLLLKCAEMKGENYMIEVWGRIFQCLYTCIIQDSEESNLFSDDRAFLSIKACIEVVSTSGMANEVLLKIVEMFNRQIVEILKYSADQNEKLSISDVIEQNEEEDEEEEDEDDYDDTDDDEMEALLSSIQQVQRTLFKMLKSVYFPFFQQTFENIINLLKSDNPPIKSWAICLLSDFVEFCPNESVQLSGIFLEIIQNLFNHKNSHVRTSTYFFCGILVEFAPLQYQTFNIFAITKIVAAILDPESRESSNIYATANAIALVGKMMKYTPSIISSFDSAALAWISWLPVVESEADFIMSYLLELIEGKFYLFSGPNVSNIFKVLDSIITMISYVDDATSQKAMTLLYQLKLQLPEAFNSWYSNLDATHKLHLESYKWSNA